MVKNVIHIFGASGSGTTTLGAKICDELGYKLLDVDDYFWLPTNPPFTQKRATEERNASKEFYKSHNVDCEIHYIEIDDETWEYQLNKRNNEILKKETKAYYLEHNRALEFASRFEKPDDNEVDIFVGDKQ